MQQAADFLDESRALETLLAPLDAAALARPTLFKNWTIEDIVQHIHILNIAAHQALTDERAFAAYAAALRANSGAMRAFENTWLKGLRGPALIEAWRQFYPLAAEAFAAADPRQRLAWFGPPMSARSAMTARQMETWAHAQAIYDLLGVERAEADRIRNIAHLGVMTMGWSFSGRGLAPPDSAPLVVLHAPSGAIWRWNEEGPRGIEGDAAEFCQVVTQTRNVADTRLNVEGDGARAWMAVAQCFAGAPHDPPLPGARRRAA